MIDREDWAALGKLYLLLLVYVILIPIILPLVAFALILVILLGIVRGVAIIFSFMGKIIERVLDKIAYFFI